jgi:serine/threonine protein phosphatase PrpC
MSTNGGTKVYQLSNDHKPSEPSERDRVIDAGGKIYVSAIKQIMGVSGMSIQRTDRLVTKEDKLKASTENALSVIESGGEAYGPHRVLPGRLSVSRAIGDAHAKLKPLGGNPHVVIATPEIK